MLERTERRSCPPLTLQRTMPGAVSLQAAPQGRCMAVASVPVNQSAGGQNPFSCRADTTPLPARLRDAT